MLLTRVRILVASLWAGSLWAVGYLVAPTLFATLSDRALAGTIAGSMFASMAWLSIACAFVLLALLKWAAPGVELRRRRTLGLVVLSMLMCTLVSHFGLQPIMAGLREAAGPNGVMESSARSQFGMLHGLSMVIYMVQSVLAGLLIWKQS